MDTKVLENLGLGKNESQIYLALLKLGGISATKISEETRIERTLCYSIINKLIDKGLISYIIENNVKYFKAAPPEKLMQDLKEKEEELKKVMPQLVGLAGLRKDKAKAEIYQGKEGIKTVLKDIIKEGKDHVIFGEEGLQFEKLFPIYSKQFVKRLEEANIKEKILFKETGKMVKAKGSEFRYLPKGYFSPTTTIVYSNKTAIIIWSDPSLTILIENQEVADSYLNYFELLWEVAK